MKTTQGGKNKRWNTEEGRVKKTKTWFHLEKLTTEIFEFLSDRNRYGNEEKKVKKKYGKKNEIKNKSREEKNEVKQKEDTQKRRWRKKDKETWDWEKKRKSNTEMEK